MYVPLKYNFIIQNLISVNLVSLLCNEASNQLKISINRKTPGSKDSIFLCYVFSPKLTYRFNTIPIKIPEGIKKKKERNWQVGTKIKENGKDVKQS